MSRKIFVFFLIFLLVFTFWFLNFNRVEKVEALYTDTFYPRNTADDAFERGNGTFDYHGDTIQIFSDTNPDLYTAGGFRFQDITIPSGVVITDAQFEAYSHTSPATINTMIYGNDVDNAQDFNSIEAIISSALRPRTDSVAFWNQNLGATGWKISPDIRAIIQEIIDHPGWPVNGGNAIALLFIPSDTSSEHATFRAYDHSIEHRPKLHISWTDAPTITSVSDDPDPQGGGLDVTFTSIASDPDGDNIILYICDDAPCTNCNPSTQVDCLAVGSAAASDPSATFPCPSCTANTYNYWAKVCDENDVCSSIIAGDSFTCKKENGCSEVTASNCFSGFSVDGYCCNSACTGGCEECDVTPGTCTVRVAGDSSGCASCFSCDGINPDCIPRDCGADKICVGDDNCVVPNLYGFAWSENIGWISFNSKNCDPDGDGVTEGGSVNNPDFPQCPDGESIEPYGVYIVPDPEGDPIGSGEFWTNLQGYAWSENIGWIRFDPSDRGLGLLECGNLPSGIVLNEFFGLIRACAGTPNPAICGGGAEPNSNSGGWDGWICMQGALGVSYKVTFNTSTNELEGWAWGGGGTSTDGTNAVVGWISFNSKNCDPDGDGNPSDGPPECIEPGRDYVANPIADYKVYYLNQAPTVSDFKIDGVDYCAIYDGQRTGQISFSWAYTDPDGDDQSQYYLLAFRLTGGFLNQVACTVDQTVSHQGKGSATLTVVENPIHQENDVKLCDNDTTQECNIDADCPPGGACIESCSILPYDIGYASMYTFRLRAYDSFGNDSNIVSYNDPENDDDNDGNQNTFTTTSHPWPLSDFTKDIAIPAVGEDVTFTEQTTFYDTTCDLDHDDPSCYYKWEFIDPPATWEGFGTDYRTATHAFISAGSKPVELTVRDSDTYECTTSIPINVGFPLPQWKEIAPF
jgi:hypothetical protein